MTTSECVLGGEECIKGSYTRIVFMTFMHINERVSRTNYDRDLNRNSLVLKLKDCLMPNSNKQPFE